MLLEFSFADQSTFLDGFLFGLSKCKIKGTTFSHSFPYRQTTGNKNDFVDVRDF